MARSVMGTGAARRGRGPGVWLCAVGLLALASGLAGCSLVLDLDELEAERRDVAGGDGRGDGEEPDGVEDPDTSESSDASELADPGDGADRVDGVDGVDGVDVPDVPDVPDIADDLSEDADPDRETSKEVVDDGDGLVPGDAETIEDTGPDLVEEVDGAGPGDSSGPLLVIRHSGMDGCTLDYYAQAVTNCPKTCAWIVTVDASDSVGFSTFHWRISVSNSYTVTPGVALGPIVPVAINTPACLLFPLTSMKPATVTFELSVDGGPYAVAARVPFDVRRVTECQASTLCLPP